MKQLTFSGFLIRFVFALGLVLASYNPSSYNFVHWLSIGEFTPLKGLAGISLVVGWVIYLRVTLRSLGLVGIGLVVTFFSFLLWLFVDLGWLNLKQVNTFTWSMLIVLAVILAIGMSWSHIRRRISGQLDTDDVDE